ncbi:hypothetical protein COLO4_38227 [Corchorus olitorius]|uniref:Uncharacterized protein n=1 Tax=Corchorus olitorius TaxID=93759 RepID=A0A1R3FWB1_9ROSI|nr:hypothetical protein COLO4_38227 [Corchorus olitorius]
MGNPLVVTLKENGWKRQKQEVKNGPKNKLETFSEDNDNRGELDNFAENQDIVAPPSEVPIVNPSIADFETHP